MSRVVVLPAPLGPSRATVSPARTTRSTPSTAATAPKCFVSPSGRRTASTHGDGTLDLFRPLPSEVARPLRTLVLVDGEHHPPVVRAAIAELSARHRVVGAVFLGGGEKLADLATVELGLSLVTG